MAKSDIAPHAPIWRTGLAAAGDAARCGAKTRSGGACRGPAMANGRCRMHGGRSTGATTTDGRERCRRANWRHGARTREAIDLRKAAMTIRRELGRLIALARGLDPTEPRVGAPPDGLT